MQLSDEQTYALQEFEKGNNLFITGPGGTGKTFLIHHFQENAKARKKRIQICAMTGCASILLNCNAKTLHSWSGIRNGKGDNSKIISDIFKNHKCKQAWKNTDILVIDEVSMMSKKIIELIDEIGKRVRGIYNKPFGGIQLVFSGDFFQLPPVGNPDEPDSLLFCFESPKWNEIFSLENHIELTTIFRQTDPIYQSILQNIRYGNICPSDIEILQSFVNRTYDPSDFNGCIPTKLFPIKSRVEQYNQWMFDQLDAQTYEYSCIVKTNCRTYLDSSNRLLSSDDYEKGMLISKKEQEKEIEILKQNTPCIPILRLKKGAAVMCTVNLDIENGICNGSLGIVESITYSKQGIPVPHVKFSNGIMKEIAIQYWQSEEYPTIAIGQFPLCLAWAMTIHKIQGATLPMAEMDIGKNIFEYGQTYVALSRVQSLNGLYLSGFSPQNIRSNPKVAEFYKKIPKVEYEVEIEIEKNPFKSFKCELNTKTIYL